MNRRELLPLIALGAAGLSCNVESKRAEEETDETQTCSLHGSVSSVRMVQLPFRTPGAFQALFAPELFRFGKSSWVCLYCCFSEMADICGTRLTPRGGKARV